MIVMKFGGSSLKDKTRVERVISIVSAAADRRPVVVVSAHGGITDKLIALARGALEGKIDPAPVRDFHFHLLAALGLDPALLESLLDELAAILRGVSLIRELTPQTMDRILSFGERCSARVVAAAFNKAGHPAQARDAFDLGFVTDSNFGQAQPLPGIRADIAEGIPAEGPTSVVTGFIGRDEQGRITTIGRNGSDYTASIIGAAIGAEEVQIWTDVDGVMTADPSLDESAQNLPVLSFEEASELSYYGAAVLHTGTLIPAIEQNIPIRVLNTNKPEEPGTTILSRPVISDRIAKSIAYKEDLTLISIASPQLMSASRLLNEAMSILSNHDIGIHIAATSVSSVSLVTDRPYNGDQVDRAAQALAALGRVTLERQKAIVCVVGQELKGRPGVLGKIFSEVGGGGIKARMVSQSASEINVAFVVDNSEIKAAVAALHKVLLGGWRPENQPAG